MNSTRDRRSPYRGSLWQGKRTLFLVIAGALCLGAAFLAAAILLTSCSASVSSAIRADGSAGISVRAEVPPLLSARFRKLAAAGGSASAGPFFDAAAIRKSIAARPSLSLVELSAPSQDSIRAEINARSLAELAASPDLRNSGLIALSRGEGWVECRFRLDRGNARSISALFPGVDPRLMDALSPPALEEDPVTVAEYTTMLRSVLGEKAMPSLDSTNISISLTAPGSAIASGGGSLSGSTLTVTIPAVQALVLEKPIEFWLRWKQ
jgi:hypothetical protein